MSKSGRELVLCVSLQAESTRMLIHNSNVLVFLDHLDVGHARVH